MARRSGPIFRLVYREQATFHTDQYAVYKGVIPAGQHRAITKNARKTNHIERFNNTLRQRVSRLVRDTFSFSKKLANHIGAIKYLHLPLQSHEGEEHYLCSTTKFATEPQEGPVQSKEPSHCGRRAGWRIRGAVAQDHPRGVDDPPAGTSPPAVEAQLPNAAPTGLARLARLDRTDAVRPHHLVVLVLDDVAVPDELARRVSNCARTRVTWPG